MGLRYFCLHLELGDIIKLGVREFMVIEMNNGAKSLRVEETEHDLRTQIL